MWALVPIQGKGGIRVVYMLHFNKNFVSIKIHLMILRVSKTDKCKHVSSMVNFSGFSQNKIL